MIEEIHSLLKQLNFRAAFVESCTGGMCAARMVSVAGASDVFEGSFVTYSYLAKTHWLNMSDVESQVLREHGTESQQCSDMLAAVCCENNKGVDVVMAVVGHISGDDRYIHVSCFSESWSMSLPNRIPILNINRRSCQEEATNKALRIFLNYLKERNV